jgi:hypothetical protein
LLHDIIIGADCIENTASNGYSIVECIDCLAMDVVLLRVYEAFAKQWPFSWFIMLAVTVVTYTFLL